MGKSSPSVTQTHFTITMDIEGLAGLSKDQLLQMLAAKQKEERIHVAENTKLRAEREEAEAQLAKANKIIIEDNQRKAEIAGLLARYYKSIRLFPLCLFHFFSAFPLLALFSSSSSSPYSS